MAFADSDSEFGYDLSVEDENLLAKLVDGAHATRFTAPTLAIQTQTQDHTTAPTPDATGGHHDAPSCVLRSSPRGKPALVGLARTNSLAAFVRKTRPQSMPSVIPEGDVQYPDLSSALSTLEKEAVSTGKPTPALAPLPLPEDDTRSPLLRFRTFPKKPLSVSDLTAGAWCELQYEYTLTRLPGGKKTRTEAMKGGSKVHQKLEDQVYTTVQVEIATKEDSFGLKVWNIIQGLRTLRDTGLTRELEVWGLIDGNVVNGLIDFLSYENPSPEFEEEWLSSQGSRSGVGAGDDFQKKITNFFPSHQTGQLDQPKDNRKVYLTDVKTRGRKDVPRGAQVRGTKVQLFLYHRFLSDMAEDKVNFLQVFRRYGLDVDAQFSDAFLAQMGELHDDVFHDCSSVVSSDSAPSSDADTHDLLRYRTLTELVLLLRSELKLTFPAGGASLGSVVTVEYRLRGDEGQLIGTNILAIDKEVLDQYLGGYMEWWRGERPALGVDVEEAYKCNICEFKDICTWREDMDGEILKRAQEKSLARAAAAAAGAGGLDGPARTRSKSPQVRKRKSTSPA